jgi:hypothetical protein
MTAATISEATERHARAYAALEPEIRDLAHMAELARFHAIESFGSNSPEETEERKREREIALFAVAHVEQMACDLVKAYYAGWSGASAQREEARS